MVMTLEEFCELTKRLGSVKAAQDVKFRRLGCSEAEIADYHKWAAYGSLGPMPPRVRIPDMKGAP